MTRTANPLCDLDEHLGQVVRETRQNCGLKIGDVCRRIAEAGKQMHRPTLSWLERGQQRWALEHVDMVAEALGIDPDVLVRMARVRRDATGVQLSENGSHAAERSATG